jgi:hypothetical protein
MLEFCKFAYCGALVLAYSYSSSLLKALPLR